MSLRINRTHQCGFSNIDFRSKKDIDSLTLYQPWTIPKDFGTMGQSCYTPSYSELKKTFSVSENVNQLKNIVQCSPDPKSYKSVQFYKDKKINPNIKQKFITERVAQLDESYIGKDIFTGDSMMIADINKFRKERKKKKRYQEQERLRKVQLKESINKDKRDKNKEAIQETQLVNIEAEETLEGKVDIKKLQEIRLALRRRYANRTNFRKIFKEWDHSIAGEISVYDAHEMINSLAIPINYNETRALLASSNKRGTETLNMQEFMHLIFNDNPGLTVDLKKIKFKEEKIYDDGIQVENLKKNMKMNILEMSKTDDIKFIKYYLRPRIPKFMKLMQEEEGAQGETCTKEAFENVLKKFQFPDRYTQPHLISAIYDSFQRSDEKGMDLKKFVEDVLTNVDKVNFFDFQDNYLNRINQKISKTKDDLINSSKDLVEHKSQKDQIKKEYLAEIEANRIRKIEEKNQPQPKEVLNPQPSTAFVNQLFHNNVEHYKTLNAVEDSFSAYPSLIKNMKGKTRFGANPPHKDTFYMINQDPRGSSHITEAERFNVVGPNLTSFIQMEREDNKKIRLAKLKVFKNYRDIAYNASKTYEKLYEQKDINTMLKRTMRLYDYELRNKMRNEIVE